MQIPAQHAAPALSSVCAWNADQIQAHFEQAAFYTSAQCQMMQRIFEHVVGSSMHIQNPEQLLGFMSRNPWSFWGKFERSDHVTVSVLLLDKDDQKVLLTRHKKLKMWLQLGGHWCDAKEDQTQEGFVGYMPLIGALKEMYEEGFNRFGLSELLVDESKEHQVLLEGAILDVDVHSVGDHNHYDVCYLARWVGSQQVVKTEESLDLAWHGLEEVLSMSTDKAQAHTEQGCTDTRLQTMVRKIQALKAAQLLD